MKNYTADELRALWFAVVNTISHLQERGLDATDKRVRAINRLGSRLQCDLSAIGETTLFVLEPKNWDAVAEEFQ